MACCKKPDVGFTQWQTLALVFDLSEYEGCLSDVKNVIVSITQGVTAHEYNIDDLIIDEVDGLIGLDMGQEESGSFTPGSAVAQINILYNDGRRTPTDKHIILIEDNLHKEVME